MGDYYLQVIPVIISALALFVSIITAWLTLFRRGRLQMTQPTIMYFGYDNSYERSPKVFLRTLLFSTAKRGHVIENMFVTLSRGKNRYTFSFWGYGETSQLVRGSGLRVGEEGVAYNHHFLLADTTEEFEFVPGEYTICVYVTTIYRSAPLLLSTVHLTLSSELIASDREHFGVLFDWEPHARRYRAHAQPIQRPQYGDPLAGLV